MCSHACGDKLYNLADNLGGGDSLQAFRKAGTVKVKSAAQATHLPMARYFPQCPSHLKGSTGKGLYRKRAVCVCDTKGTKTKNTLKNGRPFPVGLENLNWVTTARPPPNSQDPSLCARETSCQGLTPKVRSVRTGASQQDSCTQQQGTERAPES